MSMLARKFAVVAVILMVVVAIGCSKSSGPKDEEILKAITATIESAVKDATLKAPVTLLEKKQTPSGEWQAKVEYSLGMKDGSVKKETKSFNLTSSINEMGVPVWMASEAK